MRTARAISSGAVALLLLVGLLSWSGSAGAQPSSGADDYALNSSDWTGLANFVKLADQKGIDVEATDELDYHELTPEDVLVFVYPTEAIEIDNMAGFIVDGGRVLIADDYGASSGFLDRLDISRLIVPMNNLPHDRYVGDNTALPIFRPEGRHPLLEDVSTVVANHPAVLLNVGGPVVSYAEGGGLVYDMNLGAGKAIVYGDSSLLINQMMTAADNRQLVSNTLDYLCRERDPCRVKLFVRGFQQYGRYNPADSSESPESESLAERIDTFNEAVDEFMAEIPASQMFYYLGILLAAGLGLYLAAVFPMRRSRPYSRYIANSVKNVPAPQGEFDWNLSRFGSGGRETNYALPLAILKEIFEELFLGELGYWPSDQKTRPDVSELGRLFAERYLDGRPPEERRRLRQQVVEVLATFTRIPTRHRVFLDSDAYFSEHDLLKVYRQSMRILRIIGLEEEYERRTRSLV